MSDEGGADLGINVERQLGKTLLGVLKKGTRPDTSATPPNIGPKVIEEERSDKRKNVDRSMADAVSYWNQQGYRTQVEKVGVRYRLWMWPRYQEVEGREGQVPADMERETGGARVTALMAVVAVLQGALDRARREAKAAKAAVPNERKPEGAEEQVDELDGDAVEPGA